MSRNATVVSIIGFLLVLVPALPAQNLPEGASKAAVQASCANCHALGLITNAGHGAEEWQTVVDMMINDGATVPQEQVAPMVE